MNRSGYGEAIDAQELGLWRGTVASAVRGKRGQKFLKDLIQALKSLPQRKLAADKFVNQEGEYCALGAVANMRGEDFSNLSEDEHDIIGERLDIAPCLVKEVEYENDCGWGVFTPEDRWEYMYAWAHKRLKDNGSD